MAEQEPGDSERRPRASLGSLIGRFLLTDEARPVPTSIADRELDGELDIENLRLEEEEEERAEEDHDEDGNDAADRQDGEDAEAQLEDIEDNADGGAEEETQGAKVVPALPRPGSGEFVPPPKFKQSDSADTPGQSTPAREPNSVPLGRGLHVLPKRPKFKGGTNGAGAGAESSSAEPKTKMHRDRSNNSFQLAIEHARETGVDSKALDVLFTLPRFQQEDVLNILKGKAHEVRNPSAFVTKMCKDGNLGLDSKSTELLNALPIGQQEDIITRLKGTPNVRNYSAWVTNAVKAENAGLDDKAVASLERLSREGQMKVLWDLQSTPNTVRNPSAWVVQAVVRIERETKDSGHTSPWKGNDAHSAEWRGADWDATAESSRPKTTTSHAPAPWHQTAISTSTNAARPVLKPPVTKPRFTPAPQTQTKKTGGGMLVLPRNASPPSEESAAQNTAAPTTPPRSADPKSKVWRPKRKTEDEAIGARADVAPKAAPGKKTLPKPIGAKKKSWSPPSPLPARAAEDIDIEEASRKRHKADPEKQDTDVSIETESDIAPWLRKIDSTGNLMPFLPALIREFGTLEMLKYAQVAGTIGGDNNNLIACIEATFFEAIGVKTLGAKLVLAKGIVGLNQQR